MSRITPDEDTRIGELLEGIAGWVQIESPTEDFAAQNRLIDKVAADYAALGLTPQRIRSTGRGDHLLVRMPWGGNEPGILALSHLDTVCPIGSWDAAPMRREGDRVHGPGIADMKSGAYLVYDAVRRILASGQRPALPLTVLCTTDEEVGAPTSLGVIEAEAKAAQIVLVTEPSRIDGVVTARKGWRAYEMSAHGREAHSGSAPQDGRSAIAEIAHQIVRLDAMNDHAHGLTVNVGLVSGGTAANTVPGAAQCRIVTRFWTEAEGDALEEQILGAAPVTADVMVNVERTRIVPCMERTDEIVRLFGIARDICADLGVELQEIRTGGGSDGNYTAAVGTPTLDGLGALGTEWHSPNEHIFASALPRRAELMHRLICELGTP